MTTATDKARSAPQAGTTRAMTAWLAAGFIAATVAAVSLLLPAVAAPVAISASIHQSGEVSMLFAGTPESSTSPACGCVHHDPPGGWRGIVLPAQELTVDRNEPTHQATQYDISSSAPETIGALPEKFGMNVAIGIVDVPPDRVGVDPSTLKPGELVAEAAEQVRTDWLSIVVNGPLHIDSHATEPVAAVSPPAHRWTTIRYSEAEGSSAEQELNVDTSFNLAASRGLVVGAANAFPILDVLGPSVRMWGAINGVAHPYTPTAWTDPLPSRSGEQLSLSAEGWDSTWELTPPRGWVPELLITTLPPMFAARLTVRPASLSDTPGTTDSNAGAGGIVVSAPHIIPHSAHLVPLFAKAARNPTFWIKNLPVIPDTAEATSRPVGADPGDATYNARTEEFEYPPRHH